MTAPLYSMPVNALKGSGEQPEHQVHLAGPRRQTEAGLLHAHRRVRPGQDTWLVPARVSG